MDKDYKDLLIRLRDTPISKDVLDRLENMAENSKDSLTGLPDSRAFIYRLKKFLKENDSGIIALLSPDHIEQLNILSGWVIGDIAITGFAGFLEQNVGQDSFCARISGTGFAVLFKQKNIAYVKRFILSAAQFVKSLKLPGTDLFPKGYLTLSAGIYIIPANRDIKTDAGKYLDEVKRRLEYARSKGGGEIAMLAANKPIKSEKLNIKRFSLKRIKDDILTNAELETLNINGLTCNTIEPILVGEKLEFRIDTGEEIITLRGSSVWRKQIETRYNTGVKFESLCPETREALEKLISGGTENG